jgi:DMSO/TMAO reductase YedYZ molybdopterin-dependent catalytic subunit
MPARAFGCAVTAIGDHFVRNHNPAPALGANHAIVLGGAVASRLNLSLAALRRFPQREVAVTFECAGNNRTAFSPLPPGAPWNEGGVSTAIYRGVPLACLIEKAGVQAGALEVVATGADYGPVRGKERVFFARSIPIELVHDPDVILALEMNGEPLPPAHGGPLRLVVPGRYGVDNVKWLASLEVTTRPFDGPFQTEDYVIRGEGPDRPLGSMRVKSLIAGPRDGAVVAGRGLVASGWAWCGEAAVDHVDVSVDAGPWQRAKLILGPGPRAWSKWEIELDDLGPGRHTLRSRATDQRGVSQPDRAQPNALGYINNAIASAQFTVAPSAEAPSPASPARPLELSRGERVEGRGFSDPEHTSIDGLEIGRLLARFRANVATRGEASQIQRHKDGLHVLITDPAALRNARPLYGVGFFGQKRLSVSAGLTRAIYRGDGRLRRALASYPDIVGYISRRLENGDWANVVLLRDLGVKDAWLRDPVHRSVAERSRDYYGSVRIHNFELAEGLDHAFAMTRTKYYQFEGKLWSATREY